MKSANYIPPAVVSLAFGFCFAVHSQPFTQTGAPAANWVSLASSADGTRLVGAASYGGLYTSTNAGATWTPATMTGTGLEPQRPWTAVASSSDGQTLVAAADFQPLFLSTDGGGSWHQTGPTGAWAATAVSADGTQAVAADTHGGVFKSSASGWTPLAAPAQRWRSLACSADCTKIYLGSDYGTNYGETPAIYVSSDSGKTWRKTSAPAQPWQGLACSADGTRAVAGAYGGMVYLTGDSGTTWAEAGLPSRRWGGVGCSSDGTRLIAAAWEGDVHLSGDSGLHWNQAQAPSGSWLPVASSADGIHFFAGIWDSSNGGIYEASLPPVLHITPSANTTVVSWAGPATGYVLQENPDITSSNWRVVSATPTSAGGQNQVMVSPNAGQTCAYRLVKATAASPIPAAVAGSATLTAQ